MKRFRVSMLAAAALLAASFVFTGCDAADKLKDAAGGFSLKLDGKVTGRVDANGTESGLEGVNIKAVGMIENAEKVLKAIKPNGTIDLDKIKAGITDGSVKFSETATGSDGSYSLSVLDIAFIVFAEKDSYKTAFLGIAPDKKIKTTVDDAKKKDKAEFVVYIDPKKLKATANFALMGGSFPAPPPPPPTSITLSGAVSGASGAVGLSLNGAESVSSDGAFSFQTAIIEGESYSVAIVSQPEGQTCSIANNSGTVEKTSTNVSDVAVTCEDKGFTVGGTAAIVAGTTVKVKLNGSLETAITSNGSYTIGPDKKVEKGPIEVTISSIENASGVITDGSVICKLENADQAIKLLSENITNVNLTCSAAHLIRVSVTGLASGESVSVKMTDGVSDTVELSSNNVLEPFTARVANDDVIDLAIAKLPEGQECTIANAAGITVDEPKDFEVTCITPAAPTYSISGTVSGHDGIIVVTNGSDSVEVAPGYKGLPATFMFADLANSEAYSVSAAPKDTASKQECTATNGSGAIASGNVDNVTVACVYPAPKTTVIAGTATGLPVGNTTTIKVTVGATVNTYELVGGVGYKGQAAPDPTFSADAIVGDAYTVAVTPAAGFTCTATPDSGTAAEVNSVTVACVIDATVNKWTFEYVLNQGTAVPVTASTSVDCGSADCDSVVLQGTNGDITAQAAYLIFDFKWSEAGDFERHLHFVGFDAAGAFQTRPILIPMGGITRLSMAKIADDGSVGIQSYEVVFDDSANTAKDALVAIMSYDKGDAVESSQEGAVDMSKIVDLDFSMQNREDNSTISWQVPTNAWGDLSYDTWFGYGPEMIAVNSDEDMSKGFNLIVNPYYINSGLNGQDIKAKITVITNKGWQADFDKVFNEANGARPEGKWEASYFLNGDKAGDEAPADPPAPAVDKLLVTIAGSGRYGYEDGAALEAKIARPWGIAKIGDWVYFSDEWYYKVRRATAAGNGTVESVAGEGDRGTSNRSGYEDGSGDKAKFSSPAGLCGYAKSDGSHVLYVADKRNHAIRRIDVPAAAVAADTDNDVRDSTTVTTVVGEKSKFGYARTGKTDGGVPAEGAAIKAPNGVACSADTQWVYFVDENDRVYRFKDGGNIELITDTGFTDPEGIAVVAGTDGNDTVYVTDTRTKEVWKLEINATSYTPTKVAEDFKRPYSVAVSGADLIVGDSDNIIKVAADGTKTDIAGGGRSYDDEVAALEGRVYYPRGVAVDGSTIFFSQYYRYGIRKFGID